MSADPGTYSLGDVSVTTADTQTGDWVDVTGMSGFTYQLRFQYGSGGNDCRVYLQGSFDQETTAVDLDCELFGTDSEVVLLSFDGRNTQRRSGSPGAGVIPTDGAMEDDTGHDGLIPDRLRIKIVSTGTYGGSTVVSPRVVIR